MDSSHLRGLRETCCILDLGRRIEVLNIEDLGVMTVASKCLWRFFKSPLGQRLQSQKELLILFCVSANIFFHESTYQYACQHLDGVPCYMEKTCHVLPTSAL